MREIKFRGKSANSNDWICGYLYVTHDGKYEIGYYDNDSDIERMTWVVRPETVGQFTGLKDKHGAEIYEGDIIKDPDGILYRVQWQPFSASWEIENKEHFFLFAMCTIDLFEVVGNVFDNPSLLN